MARRARRLDAYARLVYLIDRTLTLPSQKAAAVQENVKIKMPAIAGKEGVSATDGAHINEKRDLTP